MSPFSRRMSALAPAPNVPNPRNAGRKKSNPVWEFFTDLRVHGLAGVRCRFCHWVTNDRSPTTMKFHLKRKHDTGAGGLWSLCEEKINQQAPVNYAPRKRVAENTKQQNILNNTSPVDFLSRPFSFPHLLFKQFEPLRFDPAGLLQAPTATATVGINAAQDEFLQTLIQQATNMAAASPPELREGLIKNEDFENMNVIDGLLLPRLDTCKNSDHSSDASFATNASSHDYNLADGSSIAGLLQIATDSDLTFTFNSRRSGEYCFESNKPEMKDRMVVFSDHGSEIRVEHRSEGREPQAELWRKSDWPQFCWAVRGACLSFLK